MNKVFDIVWCRTLRQFVMTSEPNRRGGGVGAGQPPRAAYASVLSLTALAEVLLWTAPAQAANLAMPAGAILDVNNGLAANSASNVANTFRNYSVSFTAISGGNNYVLFAFRQDPAYWTFGNVGLYAAGNTTSNLFTNPLFTQGGAVTGTSIQAPANWGVVYQTGSPPTAAGTWNAPGSTGVSTTNVNANGAGSWYDGAVGSFDGIYQGVSLVAGTTYTINFTALSNQAANTAGAAAGGNELGVFTGACLSLSGPVANCSPNNPSFTALATPQQAANAGVSTVQITPTAPATTSSLGSTPGALDGGTLTVNQPNVTATQNFTVSGNGGFIDQNGNTSTFSGTFTDASSGTPGMLNIVNSGTGGAVTLTGNNSYTGGTTFGGGTLNAGSAGALGTVGTLSFTGGTLQYSAANQTDYSSRFATTPNQLYSIDTNGQSVTYATALTSQGGSLTKLGAGTLTSTAANTYTGATTINAGTLALSDTGSISRSRNVALATGGTFDISRLTNGGTSITSLGNTAPGQTGTVALGANILTLTNAAGTFGGSLAGTGGLTLGAGTQVLTGVSTYTGATTINGGMLALSGTGSISRSSSVALATGGTFDISRLNNSGTSITSLANTAPGQTGTVALGANILTLTNAAGTFGGSIAGTGGLTLAAGTQVLTAANTYTGATTIDAGTLALAGTGSISRSSNVALATGGTFDISRLTNGGTSITSLGNTAPGQTGTVALGANILTLTNAAGTFGGTIAGTGGLTLAAGTQVLTGASTYTGATTINGGLLQVDGSIASNNVTVNSGGTLAGIGKIGDSQILSGGLLSPGNAANPTGTLTIVGPLGFAAGSFYNVAITPNANSRTNVVGTTTINGGTVIVTSARGLRTNKTYTILTSTGGVTGRFNPMPISRFAFIQATLSYDANDVYLTNRTNYVVSGATQNQTNVGAGLNAATRVASGTGRKVLNALNQVPTAQGRAVLDSLSGEGLTAAQNIANRSAELFTSSIFDQTTFYGSGNAANAITLTEPIRELADLPTRAAPPVFVQPNRTWRAWATGFGGVDDIHGNGQSGPPTSRTRSTAARSASITS